MPVQHKSGRRDAEMAWPRRGAVFQVDGEEHIYSDNHVVHWSGFVDSTLSWEVNIGDDFDIGDIGFDYILPSDSSLVESGDLQDTVPVPGNQPEEYEIDATSACQLDRCEPILGSLPKNTGATFVGSLEDQEDKEDNAAS